MSFRILEASEEETVLLREIATRLEDHVDDLVEQRVVVMKRAEDIPFDEAAEDTIRAGIRQATVDFIRSLKGEPGERDLFLRRGEQLVDGFLKRGVGFQGIMGAIAASENTMIPLLVQFYAEEPDKLTHAIIAIRKYYGAEVNLLGEILIERKEDIIAAQKEEIIASQRRAIQELSSPVIQVWEDVLVLPLVGAIDSERARRITEDLLNGIVDHQAEQVIIDITGVPVVDTSVANHLLQTIKAARLLGARCLLVGIKSEVAQAMVHLGIDLSGVVTRANLQAGIEYVLAQMGLGIAPLSGDLPPAKGRRALSSNILPSAEHQTVQTQEG